MSVSLTVGKNSFGLLTEADEYLSGSRRAAAAWIGVAPDDKRRSLISAFRQISTAHFQGSRTGVEIVDTIAIAVGGTGYAKGDTLTVDGGTFGEAALVEVLATSAGAVTALALLHAGTYTEPPSSPAATIGGSGSGCTLTLTFMAQSALLPRSGLTDCDGGEIGSLLYPTAVKHAQFELAFEINADPDLELSSGSGSNIKAAGAGSARVEYFRAQEDERRFPVPVQELLACFLAGDTAAALGAGFRSGEGGRSMFENWPCEFGLTEGY